MDLGLAGRAAAVAAASKGLGRACAEALAREGCDVAICARGEDVLRATEKDLAALGVRVHAVALDLAEPGACERFVEEAAAAFGRLDVLVANNGGPQPGGALAHADDAYRRAYESQVLVMVRLARAAVPHMRARGWGRIVFITSSAAKQPIPNLVLSNSMRPSVIAFAKTLADEVAPDGITVNCVAPGPFATDRVRALAEDRAAREGIPLERAMQIGGRIPVGRIGDPAELGALVAFLAGERAGYITGTTIAADGGQARSLL